MIADVIDNVGLGRRGEADQRRRLAVARIFPDETRDVAVVRLEVMAPLGNAMRFVDNPVSDFPLLQDRPHRGVSELLGRDEQHGGIAEADPVERVMTLGEGQEAVDGDAGRYALALQACNLVGHERDERRYDHGQSAGPVIPGEGRQLVAKRLARAGWEDPQDRGLGERRRDDGFLQRSTVFAGRLRPETREAEPLFKKAGRIAPGPAPFAGGVGAGRVTKPSNKRTGLGETGGAPMEATRSFRQPLRSRKVRRRAASRFARPPESPVRSGGCRTCRRGHSGLRGARPARPGPGRIPHGPEYRVESLRLVA